jgi:hypothetical protein
MTASPDRRRYQTEVPRLSIERAGYYTDSGAPRRSRLASGDQRGDGNAQRLSKMTSTSIPTTGCRH